MDRACFGFASPLSLAEAEISRRLRVSPHADERTASALRSLHPWDAADPCSPCWMGGGESPPRRAGAGGPAGFPPVKELRAPGVAFLGVPSGLVGCSQVGAHHDFPPALLLFNGSFLLPFSATGRCTSSPSPSRFYDYGEVGQGEESSDRTPGRSCMTWAVSPGFISPAAAHMSLPAASPLTAVWYFLLWPKGFLFVIRFSLQTSWRDSMPLSWDWMVHKALNL